VSLKKIFSLDFQSEDGEISSKKVLTSSKTSTAGSFGSLDEKNKKKNG